MMPRTYEEYIAALDWTEECPVCGYPNANEDGEPIFEEDPSFCSARCRDQYVANQRFMDDVLYLDTISAHR
jgi:hypothetical protein